jgi:hypothetical protein
MPSLPVYIGAILYLAFAAWCMGAPPNPSEGSK